MIDSHCHLADEAFIPDLDDVIGRAQEAGLRSALCVLSADEPAELERATRVARLWPTVRFSAAIHPHRAGSYGGHRLSDAVAVARHALQQMEAVGVGEIGLDYHYDFAPRDVQRDVFAAQVALALESDRPVVIHTREAWDDTIAVLLEAGRGRARGVMHCFSGSIDEARVSLEMGFFVSLAGILTFPKAEGLRDVARFVPDDRVLVETDAPFLAPVPHRGKRNEPAWVMETVRQLASLKGVPLDVMSARVADNFDALFPRAA